MNIEQERAAFESWLGVKPCGAAHDFAWEAWRGRAAQEDSEYKWRDLALQFDGHRMQALAWLKQILAESPADAWPFARTFLKSPPMSGEAVLAERIKELAALQSQDAEDARLQAVAQAVADALTMYERYGEVCPFEGEPMIHASTLVDLGELAREAIDHARRIEGGDDA